MSLGRDRRFGDNFAKELQFIPLSNDTVARRNEDVEQQPFEVGNSPQCLSDSRYRPTDAQQEMMRYLTPSHFADSLTGPIQKIPRIQAEMSN
ncbi:hypothetical protein TNCV_5063061 [Trichonephila clavipes]|nr:hypothetical protein TNCV_5063061 [Trichonephila clavipes]